MPKRVKQSTAWGNKDGSITVASEDDVYDDDHPYVLAHPDAFIDILDDPFIIRRDRPVEQATAAPGEKRATRKP